MQENKNAELMVGKAGEYLAMADLLLQGIECSQTSQGTNYDIIADIGGRLIKIQVKTTRKSKLLHQRAHPIYFFHIKRAGKNGIRRYRVGDFDCYALVALDIKKVFYMPFDLTKSTSICLRDREFDYSGNRGGGRPGFYYQDLTLENYIQYANGVSKMQKTF